MPDDRTAETVAAVAGVGALVYVGGGLAGWGWDWPAKAVGDLFKPKLTIEGPTAPVEFGTTPTITVKDPEGKPVPGALLTYVLVPKGSENLLNQPYSETFPDGTLKLVFDQQGDWGYRASKTGFRESDMIVFVVRSPITNGHANGKSAAKPTAYPGSLLGRPIARQVI